MLENGCYVTKNFACLEKEYERLQLEKQGTSPVYIKNVYVRRVATESPEHAKKRVMMSHYAPLD